MAITWTIVTLERNTDDGVVMAHWVAVGTDGEHIGSSYGTCGFTPDSSADGYTAYTDITEAQAIGWCKDTLGEEAVTGVEDSIAAQISDSKAPSITTGTPW
jgi:hypothetical protein